jgi:hypothetical protein
MSNKFEKHEGGCSCGHVRYEVTSDPLIVHACHCSWCQTQSGSAFAINALIEAGRIKVLSGEVEVIGTPSPSGAGQTIARCPKCKVAVWSNYNVTSTKHLIRFLRVGTLDDPNLMPPDVHIYTTTKQNWVVLPLDDQVAEEFYDFDSTWSDDSKARISVVQEAVAAEGGQRR